MPSTRATPQTHAVYYALLSALGFALMSACVKLASARGVPVLEIVAARALVSVLLSYLDIRRKGIAPLGHNKPLLLARGATGALALICVYYAVTTLPLAEATLLQYLHPVFTALLAFHFLGERIHRFTLICIALSLTGLATMMVPVWSSTDTPLPLLSLTAGLAGAGGSAIAYILVKTLSKTEDSSVIILYFPMLALPLSLLLLGDDLVIPEPETLGLLLLVGVFTQVGQVGLTKALQGEVANRVVAYSYVQVLFSLALGWLVFAELPSLWTLAGGGLILSGALFNLLARRG
ncbi:DMT family transporter [Ferrimonas sediminicola]|uniref:DMT family transporter n=1 Tax=Ferrimonas sediminicola TaxID=2569538 RepID=UPI00197AB19A|nr:DMT family transporter [Ferrimonas sediminicola]